MRTVSPGFARGLLSLVAPLLLAACGGGDGDGGAAGNIILTAIARGPSQVDLSWTSSPTAVTSYWLYRNGEAVDSTSTAGPVLSDSNLTPATHYCYQVVAVLFPVGEVDRSNQACVTTGSTAGWQLTTVAPTSNMGSYSSLALDAFGYAHIGYRTSTGVAYATNSPAGNWSNQTVASMAGSHGGISIAVDGAGHIHLSYHDVASSWLMYATNASGAWTLTQVATSSGYANSIAVDATGIVSIAYSSTVPNNNLKYVVNSGSGWNSSEFVAGYGSPIASISLSENPSGLPRAAYAVGSSLCAIQYASRSATNVWTDEVVKVSARCGAALALDSNGNPHVAYVVEKDLAVADGISGTWIETVADQMSWIGGPDVSVAADAGDHLHVSYQDNNSDLKYATNASGGWLSYVIDAAGAVGEHSSLRVDTAGKAHVTYDDTTNHVLKYARSP